MKLARQFAAVCFFASASTVCLAQAEVAPATQNSTQAPAPIVRPAAPKPKPVAVPSATKVAPVPNSAATSKAVASKPVAPKPKPAAKPAAKATTKTPPPALPPGQLPPGPFNRTVILIDPAHGGVDTGSRVSDAILEKDVTLSLAFKLRSLLQARGLTVVLTRDNDAATAPNSPNPLTLDDRAGIANHSHPAACLLLHATAAGQGVHLYSSELDPLPAEPFGGPWLTAQAAWVPQSQRLQKQLALALSRASLPLVSSRASIRPLDSLTCPALIVELAPTGSDSSTLNDASYQQRVAEAIAATMIFWPNMAQPPARMAPPQPAPSAAPVTAPTDATTGAQP